MSNPFDFFDKIYCINLIRRPDRWLECVKVFEELKIFNKVTRFEAADFSNDSSIVEIHRGRCGCAQSHINIVKDAKLNNYKNILIFEDDVKLHETSDVINETLTTCLNELPPDWELFYPSANPPNHWESLTDYSSNLCQVKAAFTTHSIAINESIYDILIDKFNTYGDVNNLIHKAVAMDNFYIEAACGRGKVFLAKKLLFTQRHNFSDIDQCDRNIDGIIKETYSRNPLLIL